MQDKKSQAGIIVLIVFLVIIILIGVSIAIYGTKNKLFSSKKKDKEPVKIPTITISARVSYPDGNPAKANYFLDADKITLKQGIFEKSWNEFFEMPINKSYRLCYWTDEFYRHCTIYLRGISFIPLNKNMTIFGNITMNEELQARFRKGIVNINAMDKMQKGAEQILRLNISARNGSLSRLTICTWHSIGIISLTKPEITIHCDRWLNYTFDVEGNQINLTNNMYWCEQENKIEQCTKVMNRRECIVPNANPPSRLKDKVDFCYYTGTSILNGDYVAEYNLNTMPFIDQRDYINFYIIDSELIKIDDEYPIRNEDAFGRDVGIPDILYKLNYTNG